MSITPNGHSLTRLALLAWLLVTGVGCEEPCAELEQRVCDRHEDRKRCEIMQDPERRALLSNEACESMLRAVPEP